VSHLTPARRRLSSGGWMAVIGALLAIQGAAELAMGRPPWCTCGTVKLWYGVVQSPENSQHILDWYSPSHVVHGLLFYAFARLVASRARLSARLALVTFIEATWEVLENTSLVIDRYRAATISLGYYGDSVLNSLSDSLVCILGFLLASRLPVWASVLLALALEALTAVAIRDNLTLNVLMLLYPIPAIRAWQGG
jgi:Protein of unknown function (DUF2585)